MASSRLTRVIVAGASGHARVVADALFRMERVSIVGFTALSSKVDRMFGVPVHIGQEALIGALAGDPSLRVALGIGDTTARRGVVAAVVDAGFSERFLTAVHPDAVIGRDCTLGAGCVVMAGAVINAGTTVGCHAIVNTRCSIDHDGELGNFVTISPGATLGGSVRIGPGTVIGLGASVIHGRTIGEDTIVGAGSVVVQDLPSNAVAFGVPARVVRLRSPSDPYL